MQILHVWFHADMRLRYPHVHLYFRIRMISMRFHAVVRLYKHIIFASNKFIAGQKGLKMDQTGLTIDLKSSELYF